MRGQSGIAHVENERRLPTGVARDLTQQGEVRWGPAQRTLTVDHLHGLITRPPCQTAGGSEKMGPLPDPSGLQALLPVISVRYGDESDQRIAHRLGNVAKT